jgi:CheY-like chemotaxis protein
LLVEKDSDGRRLLDRLLELAGLSVCSVGTWREALTAVERQSPQAIILDERAMPSLELTGLRSLSQHPVSPPIPIVLTVDHPSPEAERALQSGAIAAYITRPIAWERLNTTLLHLLGSPAALRTAEPESAGNASRD